MADDKRERTVKHLYSRALQAAIASGNRGFIAEELARNLEFAMQNCDAEVQSVYQEAEQWLGRDRASHAA